MSNPQGYPQQGMQPGMQGQMGQPGMQGYPQQGQPGMMQQGMQPGMQGQMGMQGQPGMQQGYPGQPGMQPGMQGQMGPGGMQGGGYQQGQQGMYGQAGMQQPGMMGQQQGMYGQPGMQQGMMGQQGMYGQPGMQQGMMGQPGMVGQQGMMGAVTTTFTVPTTFQVTRNFFAMGGEMDICMNGQPHFRCISSPSPLGFGYCFNLVDLSGNQLCNIVPNSTYGGNPHFDIFVRGMLYATLKQDWSAGEKKFELHNKQTGEHLKCYGDWFGSNFEFQRHHGAQVAQVSSGYDNNTYQVVISPGEDALFVLSAVLCIEKCCHEHRHHHKHNW